jgi:hypothetical protein
MAGQNDPQPEARNKKLAYSVEEYATAISSGRSLVFAEIRSGRLKARKIRARTVITEEDGLEYLRSLPLAGSGAA